MSITKYKTQLMEMNSYELIAGAAIYHAGKAYEKHCIDHGKSLYLFLKKRRELNIAGVLI